MTTGQEPSLPARRSSQAQDLAQLTARANEAASKLREANREGHELLVALQLERKKARDDVQQYHDAAMSEIRKTFDTAVKMHMEVFAEKLEKIKENAVKRVFAQFDEITNILMGKEDPNSDDLHDVARQYRATLEAVREVQKSEIPNVYRRPK
jgi:CHAD domain-containing protein